MLSNRFSQDFQLSSFKKIAALGCFSLWYPDHLLGVLLMYAVWLCLLRPSLDLASKDETSPSKLLGPVLIGCTPPPSVIQDDPAIVPPFEIDSSFSEKPLKVSRAPK
ncbi:MAG: hypothetical protein CMF51_00820 [Legionellales bacterium]|nr:hypothetical protein [Legionellales bacterium]|tara:strand:+ start:715 stop:1035 length:321 start_codon:yes stop_codon:yes gene_type:complete